MMRIFQVRDANVNTETPQADRLSIRHSRNTGPVEADKASPTSDLIILL